MKTTRTIWLYPLLAVIAWGCSPQNTDHLPAKFQDLENLTVYPVDAPPAATISFHKDAAYGDSGEVLFGRIGEIAVDSLGRVFISDPRNLVINAFEPDGRFIDRLGRRGSGPSEFSSGIKNLQIHRNRLYAFDPGPSRLTIFNLDSLASESALILAGNRGGYEELTRAYPWIRNVYVRSDNTFITEFTESAPIAGIEFYENEEIEGLFYLLDNTGSISREVLEFTREIGTHTGGLININDFFGRTLTGFLKDDRFLLAEPDHFLVKSYSPDGDYQRAFFYAIKKISLTQEVAEENGLVKALGLDIALMDLPETWPALTDLKIDDQNRLWIATTVENRSIYEWWVLEETGELITRFEWPRDEPIELVQNGYMYTRETDPTTGLQEVVRYRIELEES